MEWNLLEKTTFWIEGAELQGANLDDAAAAAAEALGFDPREIMVVMCSPASLLSMCLKRIYLPNRLPEKPGKSLGA